MANVRPGAMKDPEPINDEARTIAQQVKSQVEGDDKFAHYEPLSFATQLVNGLNYFIKVKVGDDKCVHVRAHKAFSGEVTLHSVQKDKTVGEPIAYF